MNLDSSQTMALNAVQFAISDLLDRRFVQRASGMLFVRDVPNKYLNMDTIQNSMYEKDPLSIFMFMENQDHLLSEETENGDL